MHTLADLAGVLRDLRRRHARRTGGAPLSYRELAAAAGWSHGIIGEYLAGRVLPPTDRFDVLVRLLGASPTEQGALATARDRVEETRRQALAAAPVGPVPHQLPAEVSGFTGRQQELATLDTLLDPAAQGESGPASAVVVTAVAGTAGVGKTTLALRWAHRSADRFPDGQLYLDLRGYDPDRPIEPAGALATLLGGLGVSATDLPTDLAGRAALYRTLLSGRRMLVVLDNAATPDQVRPLLPGTATCRTVVTSRDSLAGLVARDGARRLDLDLLTTAEAVALLRTLVGERVDAEPVAAADLADRCARLPLALRIAAERAVATPGRRLADLADDLRDEANRLDLLAVAGDPRAALRGVFSWSHRHLPRAAARAFDLLGLHPGRDIDVAALAALADCDAATARASLDRLAEAHLVTPAGPAPDGEPGWRMHDLLRAYAVERAGRLPDARAALGRLLDHYSHRARGAARALFPHDRAAGDDGARFDAPGAPTSPEAAGAWLDGQRANLVAVATHAAEHGWPEHAVALSTALWRYLEVGGRYQDALAVHAGAARAARTPSAKAHVLTNLGSTHWSLGDHRTARRCFDRSLAAFRAAGDPAGQARALARLALVYERLGDYPQSLEHLKAALAGYRQTGNRHGVGTQLLNLGALQRRLGDLAAAVARQREAAEIFADLGDRRLLGYSLGNLGATESERGEHDAALQHLDEALAACLATGDRGGEGSAHAALGAAYARMGRHEEAAGHLDRALTIAAAIGEASLRMEALNTLGESWTARGRPTDAIGVHRAAQDLAKRNGDRYEHARALNGLAAAFAATGRPEEAESSRRRARAIYRKLGVPEPVEAPPTVNTGRR
ncbi:tetratricopeptide repeat protein [Luedemannella helvata]|uniref:Tetratricopeptide repeat protein n=1 Tax=Luedemannella helvata TaxID=349315 RepID=A0ABP4X063_9ACTN